jgi:hypothetical protein
LDLNDSDILVFLKKLAKKDTGVAGLLSKGIIDRNLFKIILKNEPFSREYLDSIRHKLELHFGHDMEGLEYLLITGIESNAAYNQHINEIQLLMKDGNMFEFTKQKDLIVSTTKTEKHFMICPAFAIQEINN